MNIVVIELLTLLVEVFCVNGGLISSATEENFLSLSNKPARNCQEIKLNVSGTYEIYPYIWEPKKSVRVYCDMSTEGGGWTLIQRRMDVLCHSHFNRSHEEYVLGFSDKNKDEFWIGLDTINALTSQRLTQLRIDMWDTQNIHKVAKYRFFHVRSSRDNYRLEIEQYSGDANDSMTYHNGAPFSTWDKDLDDYPDNCAKIFRGGWWYKSCHYANLNGQYYNGKILSYADGIIWYYWKGYYESLKRVEIKLRSVF